MLADRLRSVGRVVWTFEHFQRDSCNILLWLRIGLRCHLPVLAQIQEKTLTRAKVAENSG